MLKRIKSHVGTVPIMAVVIIAFISGITTLGFYKTKQNGVLENNGKKIWCKIQNKGEAFCDEKYAFTPEAYP